MTKFKILGLLAVFALLLALPALVLAQAQPPRPPVFGGTVSMNDGSPAPDGTMVAAWIDGAMVASTAVTDGSYAFAIPQPPGDSLEGKEISFMIGDFNAGEKGTWEADGGAELNLTAAASAGQDVSLFEMNHSGQTGIATLADRGSQTKVTMTLNPGAMNTEKVHIHTGQCGADLGGVVYPLTSFTGGSGMSTKMVEATLAMLQDGNHAINLHQAGNPGLYTACGNIPKSGLSQAIPAMMAGADGADGARGAAGPRGSAGVAGPGGAAGAAGSAGAKGAAGAKGSAGAAGSSGAKGDTGAAGSSGAAGPAGPAGSAGTAGPAGSSGGGGLAIVSLIIAIVAVVGAGGAFVMGRRS